MPKIIRAEKRNLIINGAFDFWQRLGANQNSRGGVSIGYDADRWQSVHDIAAGGSTTIVIRTFTDVPPSDFQSLFALKKDVGVAKVSLAASDEAALRYRVEGFDIAPFVNRSMILSFWVKSNLTGTYSVSFFNSAFDKSYVTEYTIDSVDTWERKTISLKLDGLLTGNWLINANTGLVIQFTQDAGSSVKTSTLNSWENSSARVSDNQVTWMNSASNNFFLGDVMFHEGLFPIEFSRAGDSYEEELALCQRYYEKTYDLDAPPGTSTQVGNMILTISSAGVFANSFSQYYSVKKRLVATVTIFSTDGTSGNMFSVEESTNKTVVVDQPGSHGFTLTYPGSGSPTANTRARGHWTADAELN